MFDICNKWAIDQHNVVKYKAYKIWKNKNSESFKIRLINAKDFQKDIKFL